MKLSKNKIPKLLKSKYQSKKRYRKKIKLSKKSNLNTFRKNKITNLRQKTVKNHLKKKNIKGGGIFDSKGDTEFDKFNNMIYLVRREGQLNTALKISEKKKMR